MDVDSGSRGIDGELLCILYVGGRQPRVLDMKADRAMSATLGERMPRSLPWPRKQMLRGTGITSVCMLDERGQQTPWLGNQRLGTEFRDRVQGGLFSSFYGNYPPLFYVPNTRIITTYLRQYYRIILEISVNQDP